MTVYIALLFVVMLIGFLLGSTLGVWTYVAGIRRGIQVSMHDALVMAGVINEPIAYAELEPYIRAALEREQKAKVVSVRDEWEAEKQRLHDAGIY